MSSSSPSDAATLDRARAFLEEVRARVDERLEAVLPTPEGPVARLAEAMRYSVFAGGKRLRPALALALSRAIGGEDERALPFAAALELVHTYSLIHDDLPAMDDDELRRGRPTSHVVFGEALAILAGDALHTLAFEVLLEGTSPPELGNRVARELAAAAGPSGMVGGQVEDLAASETAPTEEALLRIQGGKTAALIRAACRGGAWIGGADEAQADAAGGYGHHLGHAFQMVDDVLDVTGTAAVLGKTPGKDAEEHRCTWVAYEGVDAAMARAESEVERALEAAKTLPGYDLLRALALFVTRRDR